MDDAFNLYHDRIIGAVAKTDVTSLFFPQLGKAMILDMRRGESVPAAVFLDDMAATPEERLASFRRLRPELPLPPELTLAAWDGKIRGLEESGVLEAILARCLQEGGERLVEAAEAAYATLRALERDALRRLVAGPGMHTLWRRTDP